MTWELFYTKRAKKDYEKIKSANLTTQVERQLTSIRQNPYVIPPPYEKLVGDLTGFLSRRINLQHRLVYEVLPDNVVKVHSMFTHYNGLRT